MSERTRVAPAVADVLRAARSRPPPADGPIQADARPLAGAIAAAAADGRTPVVAEVKPTSPTTAGERDVDPVAAARAMADGGAAAVSVLTEPAHFGGSPAALRAIRDAVDLPVLRKDFVLTAAELDRVAADAVLLIARFLEDLPGLVRAARERGMTPLVEVHVPAELDRAVASGATVVGINNRDLARLTVDLGTVERLAPDCPADATVIAESGIAAPADVRRMRAAGADALLVGSAIMGEPGSATGAAGEAADDGASGPTPAGIQARTRELVRA